MRRGLSRDEAPRALRMGRMPLCLETATKHGHRHSNCRRRGSVGRSAGLTVPDWLQTCPPRGAVSSSSAAGMERPSRARASPDAGSTAAARPTAAPRHRPSTEGTGQGTPLTGNSGSPVALLRSPWHYTAAQASDNHNPRLLRRDPTGLPPTSSCRPWPHGPLQVFPQ